MQKKGGRFFFAWGIFWFFCSPRYHPRGVGVTLRPGAEASSSAGLQLIPMLPFSAETVQASGILALGDDRDLRGLVTIAAILNGDSAPSLHVGGGGREE